MSPTVEIRTADPNDADAIRIIARAAYCQYIAAIGREPAPMVADFDTLIAQGHVHVAFTQWSIAGFIVFYPDGDAMHLENVAVAQSGQGTGGALIRHCENAARQLSLPRVTLYTNVAMTANLTLYPALGYVEVARRRENGFDRVYFEKDLT